MVAQPHGLAGGSRSQAVLNGGGGGGQTPTAERVHCRIRQWGPVVAVATRR
ncbi:hypothetical protein GW17_00047048, partial [Ensete ventricosum]